MKYISTIWEPEESSPYDSTFLTDDAEKYLGRCEDEVYSDWESHFPSDKSLANVLSRTVLTRLDNPGFAISPNASKQYGVLRAFHHRSSTSDLFVEIFRRLNHEQISDFLIITQTPAFKQKFLYDNATMTVDTISVDYSKFLYSLCLRERPRLFLLSLADLEFSTDVLRRGTKKYLKLNK